MKVSEVFIKVDKNGHNRQYVTLECDCGKLRDVLLSDFKHKKEKYHVCFKCSAKNRRLNIQNKRYGKIIAKEYIGTIGNSHGLWRCECDCGGETFACASTLESNVRKSCGCEHYALNTGSTKWEGYKGIPFSFWKNIVKNAVERNLLVSVTIEQIWDQFVKQNSRCALSGKDLYIKNIHDKNASLDRIDSSKGYEIDNIQWIHKDINLMKWNLEQDYFIELCKDIYLNSIKSCEA